MVTRRCDTPLIAIEGVLAPNETSVMVKTMYISPPAATRYWGCDQGYWPRWGVTPSWCTVSVELRALREALDDLTSSGPGELSDPESIAQLQIERARLDAFVTARVADFEASGAWAPSGARTASAWLAHQCRIPKNEASAQVRRGRHCAHLPLFEAAWSAGRTAGSSAAATTASAPGGHHPGTSWTVVLSGG
jgi:hypothetical protein